MTKLLEDILTKEYLLDCIRRGMTQQDVADEVGRLFNKRISRQSVFYWMRRHGLQWGRKVYEPVSLDVEAIVEATNLVDKVISQIGDFKNLNNIIRQENNDVLFLAIGDVHAGAKYDRTGRINWKDVLSERFGIFRDEVEKKLRDINLIPSKIIICLLGDLVDGFEIYPNQAEMSDTIVSDQIDLLLKELIDTILYLSAFTKEVKIYAVQGNHGRISKRSEINNWDSVVYVALERIIDYITKSQKEDEIVNISITRVNKFLLQFQEGKWKYLIGHGHRLLTKSSLGSVKYINNMVITRKSLGFDHNVFIMGHVHQTRYWCNGDNSYYISNGTMYDSEHFSETLGLPSDLRFVAFTSNDRTPVDMLFFIPLVPESYYRKRKNYLF